MPILWIVIAFAQVLLIYPLPGGTAFLQRQFNPDWIKLGPPLEVHRGLNPPFRLTSQWSRVHFESWQCYAYFDAAPYPMTWVEFQGPIMPGAPLPKDFKGETRLGGKFRVRMSHGELGKLPWYPTWIRGSGTITYNVKC